VLEEKNILATLITAGKEAAKSAIEAFGAPGSKFIQVFFIDCCFCPALLLTCRTHPFRVCTYLAT
jgi:hypothetical protein